jgi:Mn2+/Fe2+ NRAMP family transporter
LEDAPMRRRRHPIGRHPHELVRRRRLRRRPAAGLLLVLGPGLLAGLSDDDPPGITTYSILGAEHGYRLLWVLALSTAALIVFHEVAARAGIATGKGFMRLLREQRGRTTAAAVLAVLVTANAGTLCAEFAGLAAGAELLGAPGRAVAVPVGAIVVAALVIGGSFHRVEHVLLALSAVFVSYIGAGVLSEPDWGAAARGLVVPDVPAGRDTAVAIVAAVGTTLAPWGLVFIQSYAVDKRLRRADLRYERIDVVTGAVLTGVIGCFVLVACAATLWKSGIEIDDAQDAARALEPLAGSLAAQLFGIGFVGAALLAVAVVPLSTAYSVAEAFERPADLDLPMRDARLFYGVYAAGLALGAGVVLMPGVPLVELLYLSQALNAILLLAILPFLRAMARDAAVMGDARLGRTASTATAAVIALVATSVVALAVLSVT